MKVNWRLWIGRIILIGCLLFALVNSLSTYSTWMKEYGQVSGERGSLLITSTLAGFAGYWVSLGLPFYVGCKIYDYVKRRKERYGPSGIKPDQDLAVSEGGEVN